MSIAPYPTLSRWLHRLFEASLLIKGLFAGSETSIGLGLLFTPNALILRAFDWMTRHELTQDPQDPLAMWFGHQLASFTGPSQHFFAIYLLMHGALKLVMVLLLARRILWGYPASMVVLAGFVMYQMNKWTYTHSPALLLLSLFDILMIVLVAREYKVMLRATIDPA